MRRPPPPRPPPGTDKAASPSQTGGPSSPASLRSCIRLTSLKREPHRVGRGDGVVNYRRWRPPLAQPSGSQPDPEVPDDHHHIVPIHRDRRRRAGVHQCRAAGFGWVPGRLHRPDPRRVRPRPAPVRQLVPPAPCQPLRCPPPRHRVLRPRPGAQGPGAGHGHTQAVHDRRVLPVRRRGRIAGSFPGRPCPPAPAGLRVACHPA